MARKQKIIHYIYKTTCLITNRYYIGMHSTIKLKDGYMGSGKRLRYSIRKHGIDNHVKEIIEFFKNRELLIEAEKKAITLDMITDRNCMNLKSGGEGGFINEEHKQKFIESGSKHFDKFNEAGKKRLDEIRGDKKLHTQYNKKIQISLKEYHKENDHPFKDKKHSDETKNLMSESSKGMGVGETNSQYGTCWITKEGFNKKIKKECLKTFINENWILGRKL